MQVDVIDPPQGEHSSSSLATWLIRAGLSSAWSCRLAKLSIDCSRRTVTIIAAFIGINRITFSLVVAHDSTTQCS